MQWTRMAVLAGMLIGCGGAPHPAKPAESAFPAHFLARLPLGDPNQPVRPDGPHLPPWPIPDPSLSANRGAIAGVVRDKQGRPVSGVEVILRATDLPAAVHTVTAPDGSFEFRDVPPGKAYTSVIQGETCDGNESDVKPGQRTWIRLVLMNGDPVPIEQRPQARR